MELPAFLLFTILSMLAFSYPELASSRPHDNFTDLESLLAFKFQADRYGALSANWTTNASFCDWLGVYCSHRQHRVTAIRLRNFPLKGTISPHLGNLSFLSELDLANGSLTGPIPASIGHLRRLSSIFLSHNSLSGLLPFNILNISSLLRFYVTDNNLSGSFPSNNSFTMPPRLSEISLGANYFTGDVLPSFLQCRDVKQIGLSDNQFSGTLPAEIGSLSELNVLFLSTNQLTGTIPPSLGNLTKLMFLDLSRNNFSGILPDKVGDLENLQFLTFAENDMVGSIPTSLLNISKVRHFDLSANKLSGSVPDGIGKSLPMLEWFHVGHNRLSGDLKFLSSLSNCKNLDYLQIFKNTLDGALPNDIGNLSTNLQYFDASENLIKGNIPSSLVNLSGLVVLVVEINELTGILPSTLAGLESLQSLNLAFNGISGLVPPELGLMKKLNGLSLRYNKLFGPIPESLANISMLQNLYLDNNNFSACIPKSLWTLASLLRLDLSGNNLNGSLPPELGKLKALIFLNLSMNLLSGNITSDLGELSMLTFLDLSKNLFQGQIPESLGRLISVTYLNLSSNFLSGVIPGSLANLTYLDRVDLSFNKLEGLVPKGRVFLNSSIPSLIGNEGLCGAPQLHIPPCSSHIRNNSRINLLSLKYILLFTMLGMLLLTLMCLIYAFLSRNKFKTEPDTNEPRLDYHRAVAYYELVHATENFSESNLIGKGGFGSVFKGCLDGGLVVAIKVLNLEVEGSLKSFDAECQVLKMARHKNLIKIVSVCSNLDFKALVLQYMPNGSLDQWLYSENYFLSIMQRLEIMVDVSLALEYLHHRHPQVVLHCDLKPKNILLDDEMVAHVSDFGISKMLLGDSGAMVTTRMPGTIGYIAPEYISTGAVSRMADVYSFGILVLEIIAGKNPLDNAFGEQSSLREWIQKAYPTAIWDVVDEGILKDYYTNNEPSPDLSTLHRCLSSVIELGLLCSSYSPKERIPMTNVSARLQKIKIEYLSTQIVE